MKKNRWHLGIFLPGLILFLFTIPVPAETESILKPPLAEKIPQTLTIHGHTRVDDYYWLNERNNPQVTDYLKEENAYTAALMKHTEKLQQQLYNEMVGRMKQTDMSLPNFDNGYWYYSRFEEGKEYPIYCRKRGTLKANEETLLNGNKMAEGHAFFRIGDYEVSPDNRLLAYSVDIVSRRQYKIHFKNLKTGQVYPDTIAMASGSLVWAGDNKTIFYPLIDDTLRSFKICRHVLGTPVSQDQDVFVENDATFEVYATKSRSKKYVFITSQSTLTSEYRFLESDLPQNEFRIFQPRQAGVLYDVNHLGERFFIQTNDGAKNFKLMDCPVDKTAKENWRELIAHRSDVLLENFILFNDFLVLNERKNGLTQIHVIPWGEKEGYYLEFPDRAYTASARENTEAASLLLRYYYNSLSTPDSIFAFNMKTRENKLLKRKEVLGGYNPADYTTERLMAPAFDGTLIPISLIYKKGLSKNSDTPLLLYGYGSYGASMDPGFNANRISLLARGFIYAIAHIRGGQEMGRYWYEEGKLFKKMNTFTDFISCGEYLIRHGYSSPAKLCAMGGSAGGLLMGAVVNLRPDLFKAVIAAVPFVDVVTTMLDSSIPLTTGEYDEWGDPHRPDCYEYMLTYSPYDNVRAKQYPALFVTTGLHDSQVQYWEPAKWVAKLRITKTDKNLLLLQTNMEAGHGGASGRFQILKEVARQYAFLLDQVGCQQ